MPMKKHRKKLWLLALAYVPLAVGYLGYSQQINAGSWRTATREPAGLAPDPATTPAAVVQVYSARTVSWRGYFGVHTWVSAKRSGEAQFTVYEVMGYRLRRTGTAVVVGHERAPDGYWFGNRPQLLADLRGEGVDAVIDRIDAAVTTYPYPAEYRAWPGPNSNTFVAHLLRAAPELRVDLPPTAIGKDYLGARAVRRTPSGTGVQANLLGVAGVLAGVEEGIEVNLLGLTFGVDPLGLAIKLPLIGRIGPGGDAKASELTQAQGR